MTEHLNCKRCGYKQYDKDVIDVFRKQYPDMELHDIPYICGACMDNMKDELFDRMRDKYDDDPWCGDAAASAIADVSEDYDPDMSDREIENRVYDYVKDVYVQSLLEYLDNHMKEIVDDIRHHEEYL